MPLILLFGLHVLSVILIGLVYNGVKRSAIHAAAFSLVYMFVAYFMTLHTLGGGSRVNMVKGMASSMTMAQFFDMYLPVAAFMVVLAMIVGYFSENSTARYIDAKYNRNRSFRGKSLLENRAAFTVEADKSAFPM